MKKIILITIVCALIFSCKKENKKTYIKKRDYKEQKKDTLSDNDFWRFIIMSSSKY